MPTTRRFSSPKQSHLGTSSVKPRPFCRPGLRHLATRVATPEPPTTRHCRRSRPFRRHADPRQLTGTAVASVSDRNRSRGPSRGGRCPTRAGSAGHRRKLLLSRVKRSGASSTVAPPDRGRPLAPRTPEPSHPCRPHAVNCSESEAFHPPCSLSCVLPACLTTVPG